MRHTETPESNTYTLQKINKPEILAINPHTADTPCFLPTPAFYCQYWFCLHRLRFILHILISRMSLMWISFFPRFLFQTLAFRSASKINLLLYANIKVISCRFFPFVHTGDFRNRSLNILWVETQICSRRETPPALPIPELRIAPGRAVHLPGRASSKSEAIRCQEVRGCNTVILQFYVVPWSAWEQIIIK